MTPYLRQLLRRLRRERGAVTVLVTVTLPVLILFASFVVDSGDFFSHKRHLQMQVDAAALAGGDAFASCFNGVGNQGVFDAATVYTGATSAQSYFPGYTPSTTPLADNKQIGGTSDSVHVLYNSNTFYNGTVDSSPIPVGSVSGGPCASPYIFDVKATESSLPLFFGGLFGVARSVSAINARARVQLNQLNQINPSLPLAVPDIRPKYVTVTFVDASTGAPPSGCAGGCVFPLSGPTLTNGLNVWTGNASLPLPATTAGTNILARVGLGGGAGSCAGISTGANYVCYDAGSTTTGLLQIRDYAASGGSPSGTAPAVLRAVWPYTDASTCGNTTSPFFYLTSGTCGGAVNAVVDFGTKTCAAKKVWANVTRASGGGNGTTVLLTSLGAAPAPLTGTLFGPSSTVPYPFALPALSGPSNVTISWLCGSGNNGTNFAGRQQQFYSGFYNDGTSGSGPIQLAQLSSSSPSPAPYALAGATTQTVAISIGLQTSYSVSTPCSNGTSGATYLCPTDKPTLLHVTTNVGSHTYAVDCGTVPGSRGGTLYSQLRYGCQNQFQINANDICPDAASPSPPDCAPIANVGSGNQIGQVQQALNDKFDPTGSSCAPNNYPTVTPGDPRAVTLIITDFSAFDGNGGNSSVPVVTFGAFYVTGWDGADRSCSAVNEPAPPSNSINTGQSANIWGHFVRYVSTLGGGSQNCVFNGLDPCVPVLTK